MTHQILDNIPRTALDAHAAESQRRAARAIAEGRFEKSLIPVYNERAYLRPLLLKVLNTELPEGLERELRGRGHRTDVLRIPLSMTPRAEIVKNCLLWRMLDLEHSYGERIDLFVPT